MSHVSLEGVFVMLCDWRGHCTWKGGGDLQIQVGELVWQHLQPESQQEVKLALGQVVAIRETRQLEVVDQRGDRFRAWVWPLHSPEVAVCILGVRVPGNLALLTERERECLEYLAEGLETRQIAANLDVSVSTVHTHLKHAREKLEAPTLDALISFAARHCYPSCGSLRAPSETS